MVELGRVSRSSFYRCDAEAAPRRDGLRRRGWQKGAGYGLHLNSFWFTHL
jgi:hypothetical protein